MSKSKVSLPIRTEKKLKKAVRKGVLHTPSPSIENDTKKPSVLSSFVAKVKNVFQPKQKNKFKQASNPAEFRGKQKTPQSAHVEGKRWVKTLKKQTAAKNILSRRKETKKTLKTKP